MGPLAERSLSKRPETLFEIDPADWRKSQQSKESPIISRDSRDFCGA